MSCGGVISLLEAATSVALEGDREKRPAGLFKALYVLLRGTGTGVRDIESDSSRDTIFDSDCVVIEDIVDVVSEINTLLVDDENVSDPLREEDCGVDLSSFGDSWPARSTLRGVEVNCCAPLSKSSLERGGLPGDNASESKEDSE